MNQPMAAATVVSPCMGLCRLDLDDICKGCHRSIAEIIGWLDADDTTRLAIRERARLRGLTRPQP